MPNYQHLDQATLSRSHIGPRQALTALTKRNISGSFFKLTHYPTARLVQGIAACCQRYGSTNSLYMTTKSREYLFGQNVKGKAEQAAAARKNADRLACEAWNAWMLGSEVPRRRPRP